MLTREQLHAFLCMRKHRRTIWSAHDTRLIPYICQVSMANFNPDSEIAKLLGCIAYGDLQSAKDMLEVNPRLVLQTGHVVTPSGLKLMHTTPLECALGAGDPDMAKMIAPYFEAKEIDGGVSVREELYARYRIHIEKMMAQPPYDFTLLVETLKQASPEDIDAAINHDTEHPSALNNVLEQFRNEFTPNKITGGMHFRYQDLQRAYEVYNQEYDNLGDEDDLDKNTIFSCQVIGFIQRNLPAIDRMVFAQSLYEVLVNKAEIKRSFQFAYEDISFPVTAPGHSSRSGLGFEYYVTGGIVGRRNHAAGVPQTLWADYVEQKLEECKTFANASKLSASSNGRAAV
jgi:hypothetical protein